jgi:hypothetical protein
VGYAVLPGSRNNAPYGSFVLCNERCTQDK